jgi:hypothetical protein
MSKPKRPRDPNQLSKMIVDIATGEIDEPKETKKTRGLQVGRWAALRATWFSRLSVAAKLHQRPLKLGGKLRLIVADCELVHLLA